MRQYLIHLSAVTSIPNYFKVEMKPLKIYHLFLPLIIYQGSSFQTQVKFQQPRDIFPRILRRQAAPALCLFMLIPVERLSLQEAFADLHVRLC